MPTIANITVQDAPTNPAIKIVNVAGELDESNLPEFEAVVNPLIQDETIKALIFNLEGLEFMSSKIIGYLASVYTKLSSSQRQIIATNINQTINDILVLVGLDQLLTVYSTVDEALNNL